MNKETEFLVSMLKTAVRYGDKSIKKEAIYILSQYEKTFGDKKNGRV